MKKIKLIALLLVLPLMIALTPVKAQGQELALTNTSVVFTPGINNTVIAQYLDFYKTKIDFEYEGEITSGDFFTVVLDDELVLHPQTLTHLGDFLIDGEIVAKPSIIDNTITYTFIRSFPSATKITGSLEFNNSIKDPLPGAPNTDQHGKYIVGTLQTLNYRVGGNDHPVDVKHRAFPTETDHIYYVNSWYNSGILENAVEWDPSILGSYLKAYVSVFNGEQFQWKDPLSYPTNENLVLDVRLDSAYGTFHVDNGLQIVESRFNTATLSYDEISTRIVSSSDIGYTAGSEEFTIDFDALGYTNYADGKTRFSVEYYINYVEDIPYFYPNGDPTNMASVSYENQVLPQFDGAFWNAVQGTSNFDSDNKPIPNTTVLLIQKDWDLKGETVTVPDVKFEVYADGVLLENLKDIIILSGEREFYIRNLPYTDSNGKVIDYTIKEVPLDDYNSELLQEGNIYKFTNSLIIPDVPLVPVDPVDPPLTPEEPTVPKEPIVDPIKPNVPDGKLPATGIDNRIPYGAILLLVGAGVVLFSMRRKKDNI